MLEVAIADDHAIVRDGLSRLLELNSQYRVANAVTTAEELIQVCHHSLPDLIFTDLSMPGMGGIEGLRRLLTKWPKLKIIVFSIYANPKLAKRVLSIGGLGYITKSSEAQIIVEGINSVSNGKQFVSPDIIVDIETSALENLSTRELDIFRGLGEGHSVKQISNNLFLSEKTIANNICTLKNKLNMQSTNELIHLAVKETLLISNA